MSLANAMAKSPETFPRVYVAMVEAGEAGGFLNVVLAQIAEFQAREKDLKSKVMTAMLYPCILLVLALVVLVVLLTFFIPKFQQVFATRRFAADDHANHHQRGRPRGARLRFVRRGGIVVIGFLVRTWFTSKKASASGKEERFWKPHRRSAHRAIRHGALLPDARHAHQHGVPLVHGLNITISMFFFFFFLCVFLATLPYCCHQRPPGKVRSPQRPADSRPPAVVQVFSMAAASRSPPSGAAQVRGGAGPARRSDWEQTLDTQQDTNTGCDHQRPVYNMSDFSWWTLGAGPCGSGHPGHRRPSSGSSYNPVPHCSRPTCAMQPTRLSHRSTWFRFFCFFFFFFFFLF